MYRVLRVYSSDEFLEFIVLMSFREIFIDFVFK